MDTTNPQNHRPEGEPSSAQPDRPAPAAQPANSTGSGRPAEPLSPADGLRTAASSAGPALLKTVIDLTIKIGALLLVLAFCFRIVQPFVNILLWSAVIAVILHPVYSGIVRLLGRRRKIAALLLAITANAVILVPSLWLIDSVANGIKSLSASFAGGSITVPPPPESIAGISLAGTRLQELWASANTNLNQFLIRYLPAFREFGEKILGSLAGTGVSILQFVLSIIVAALFLTRSERASENVRRLFTRLVGERGIEFTDIIGKTIRNVATGVIGVALIQSALIGIGLVVIKVPAAGVWIVVSLVVAIAQIPLTLVTAPIVIWLFVRKPLLTAVIWTVYLLIVGLMDNVLKPLFMGKGASVPMLVVFLGAIGGFIAYGFLGLFLGSIVLSLGYKLYIAWQDSN